MANPVILPSNFESYNFILMSRKEKNPKNRLRLLAMAHLKEGKTLQQISDSIKVHWKTIQTWLRNFRKRGITGLYVKATRVKPHKLSKQVDNWIVNFLTRLSSCDTGGYLTGKQLLSLIEQEFSVKCCLQTIYNTLHRLKFSWISSRSKHPKSDHEVQELYKKFSTAAKTAAST